MTDTTQQPEALRLAAWLNEGAWHQMTLGDVEAAGRELRRQHNDLTSLYNVIGLHRSQSAHVLVHNFENIKRFSDYLDALEREFFMVPGEPSDEPEDEGMPGADECLMQKWPAASTAHYVEQFRAALAVKFPPTWIPISEKLPDTPSNTDREFIVAIKRAHNGKTYVMSANYLNAKLLLTDEDDDPEDGSPFTGWYKEMTDDGDYDTCWHSVETQGDVVTHWMPLPASPETAL